MFSEFGFAGTSIRQVTAAAEVALPAVHYHFGSKRDLFREVVGRCFRPLDQVRLDALDVLEAECSPAPVPVERLVRVLVESALKRADDPQHGASWLRLIGRLRMEDDLWNEILPTLELHVEMMRRYTDALDAAMPDTRKPDVRIRQFFMICTISNALIDDKTLPLLASPEKSIHESPNPMGEALIRFVTAGLEG